MYKSMYHHADNKYPVGHKLSIHELKTYVNISERTSNFIYVLFMII